MRKIRFDIELYEATVTIIDTENSEDLEKLGVEVHTIDGNKIWAYCTADPEELRDVFIVVNTKFEGFEDYILVHECVHASNYIFQAISHRPPTTDDEPQAYLISHIFKKAKDFLSK